MSNTPYLETYHEILKLSLRAEKESRNDPVAHAVCADQVAMSRAAVDELERWEEEHRKIMAKTMAEQEDIKQNHL